MYKIFRRVAAVLMLLAITLLFLDFTGTLQKWFGWAAKIQFLPALLSLNLLVIAVLIVLTLIFGRLYCSVICPLGVMQDSFAWLGKRAKRFRYNYSPAKTVLRYVFLLIMAVGILVGIPSVVALLAPYSAYGRIAQSFLSPLWRLGNNALADWAEAHDSYTFYQTDIWPVTPVVIAVAGVTLLILVFLAWRNGRTYCNTICPVGTFLGLVSRFSILRPVIDTSKCNSCGLCARNCKSACINSKEHTVDMSRCVVCFDCIKTCNKGAISYTVRSKQTSKLKKDASDESRRAFMAGVAGAVAATAAYAAEKTTDGGLAVIEDKIKPERKNRIVPPGAVGLRHMADHCTACQLCVSACPNQVLRPSTDIATFMQPESSYERGYCRPECVRCSEVCPTGAIRPLDVAEKSAVQVGHAVWIRKNCVPLTDGVECGNCARHCPTGAITMVHSERGNDESPMIPAVDASKCIGCGACENLCPARPFSAIYVEGHNIHRSI